MEAILVACPMEREASALRGQLGNREVISTGVGIRRTLPALLKRFRHSKPELLIFTGSVSQLDLRLAMRDVVLPEAWVLENGPTFRSDVDLLTRLRSAGLQTVPKGLTTPKPVMKAEKRSQVYSTTGASVYDSVTAAVLRVTATEGVPCLTPKIVASTAKSGLMSFWGQVDRNLEPLAEYLETIFKILGSTDSDRLPDIARPGKKL
jgi:nucleoside phosphorylase